MLVLGQGVAHALPNDRSTDQHRAARRKAAHQTGHQGGVDPTVVEQAIHGLLAELQIIPLLHHPLQIGHGVEHQQRLYALPAHRPRPKGLSRRLERKREQGDHSQGGQEHSRPQRLLGPQHRHDHGQYRCQLQYLHSRSPLI